jgi:hypothetical protein
MQRALGKHCTWKGQAVGREEADQVRPPSSVTKAPLEPGGWRLDATTVHVDVLGQDRTTDPSMEGPEELFVSW